MNSRVEEIYLEYKTATMKDGFEGWDEEVYRLVLVSELELQRLKNLFAQETDIFYKLDLADILARLQCKDVVPFLIYTIEHENDELDKFLALISLVKMKDYRAAGLALQLLE